MRYEILLSSGETVHPDALDDAVLERAVSVTDHATGRRVVLWPPAPVAKLSERQEPTEDDIAAAIERLQLTVREATSGSFWVIFARKYPRTSHATREDAEAHIRTKALRSLTGGV
ncbi:hypothetical protein [Bradyrhizobium manausense]|uniref:Uncharacterized protein n=1 Tax=Bradyrhizobium manausense TaxID=989370 RepID=A0A0R3D0B6_9BRAD|nr:hypothetical protein [Bradyrhizobium manausense]KRQ03275.1 hypothetical protein AOQ71_31600 [Bradyrhizobium manausense]